MFGNRLTSVICLLFIKVIALIAKSFFGSTKLHFMFVKYEHYVFCADNFIVECFVAQQGFTLSHCMTMCLPGASYFTPTATFCALSSLMANLLS